jgi:ribosomal protein S12 methylthiotransferase accessory factor
MEEMVVSFPGGKKVDSRYKQFTVRTDQPREEGGDGSAPEPYDLFLSSLATCAGVYILYFCEKRDISVDGLQMTVQAEKNEKTHLFEAIRLRIQLPPGFPEKYRSAVMRAAEMCTVKRSFADPPQVEVRLEE